MKKSLILTRQQEKMRRIKIFLRIVTLCFCICMCAFFIVSVEAAESRIKYDFPEGSASVDVYNNGRRILVDESAIIESVT